MGATSVSAFGITAVFPANAVRAAEAKPAPAPAARHKVPLEQLTPEEQRELRYAKELGKA